MKKRRVTLNLDEDVSEALEALGARSLSAAANDALRRAVAIEAHRAALLRWLDELDSVHGGVTDEEADDIETAFAELESPADAAGAA